MLVYFHNPYRKKMEIKNEKNIYHHALSSMLAMTCLSWTARHTFELAFLLLNITEVSNGRLDLINSITRNTCSSTRLLIVLYILIYSKYNNFVSNLLRNTQNLPAQKNGGKEKNRSIYSFFTHLPKLLLYFLLSILPSFHLHSSTLRLKFS